MVKYVEVTKKKNEADNAYIKMNDLKGKKKTIPIFSLLLLYSISYLHWMVDLLDNKIYL